jgi:hypothetical protein
MARTAIELHRHITRAIENGRGVRLERHDLDFLVASGAIEHLSRYVDERLRETAAARAAERVALAQTPALIDEVETSRQRARRVVSRDASDPQVLARRAQRVFGTRQEK